MNVSRVFPLIRDRDRVSVFVQIYVGPRFLGGIVLILVVRCNLWGAGIRGNIATMHRFFARVVTLKGNEIDTSCDRVHKSKEIFQKKKKKEINNQTYYIVWLKKKIEK